MDVVVNRNFQVKSKTFKCTLLVECIDFDTTLCILGLVLVSCFDDVWHVTIFSNIYSSHQNLYKTFTHRILIRLDI